MQMTLPLDEQEVEQATSYLPSKADIERGTAAIQDEWTPAERAKRSGAVRFTVPEVHVAEWRE